LRELIRETTQLLESMAKKQRAQIAFQTPDTPVMVCVDPGQIQQVMTNLLVNAMQSMPDGGGVTIELRRVAARPPDDPAAVERAFVRVDVEDEGEGVASEDLEHVFDPFFTTKDVGEGTGMGLSVAHGIARDHGGWLTVSSVEGHGSCFSLFLPQEDEA
jgi:signal transduction histidine kinase